MKKQRGQHYEITREKFFDTPERDAIINHTRQRAAEDQAKGRTTWVNRWMLVHLAFYSGLRVAEIADLNISDVFIHIEKPYIKVKNGKGSKPRIVNIDNGLVGHLKEFIQGRRLQDPLFDSNGKKYTTAALWHSFKQAVKAAGLREDLTIHSARHTYATFLYDRTGENMRYVQKQLGHSSLKITALYADVLPEKNSILANMILKGDEHLFG